MKTSTRPSNKRRNWLILGGAAAATAAGLGWRLVQERQPLVVSGAAAAAGSGTASSASTGLWSMQFEQLNGPKTGQPLALASLRGQPLLLNFWGTWCPPCVREMPELDRFARAHAAKGWRVLGLAVDNAAAVQRFLATTPVGYAVALAGFDGAGLSRELGNTAGGLPFTVAFDRQGRQVQQKAGETTAAELAAWAAQMG
jgi:thiol-disulfide isomerase/thioredoxin